MEQPKKKTYVEDIERALYDIKDIDRSRYKSKSGLTEEIIRDISQRKDDPRWMLDFRLKSLEVYHSLALPAWGPDISELNMDELIREAENSMFSAKKAFYSMPEFNRRNR